MRERERKDVEREYQSKRSKERRGRAKGRKERSVKVVNKRRACKGQTRRKREEQRETNEESKTRGTKGKSSSAVRRAADGCDRCSWDDGKGRREGDGCCCWSLGIRFRDSDGRIRHRRGWAGRRSWFGG